MDLLFRRYANPFLLLDQMLFAGRLKEFIETCVKMHNEEMQEKTAWEFFLHKVFDRSFEEFAEEIKTEQMESDFGKFDEQYVETTVEKSRNILKKFRMQ